MKEEIIEINSISNIIINLFGILQKRISEKNTVTFYKKMVF